MKEISVILNFTCNSIRHYN